MSSLNVTEMELEMGKTKKTHCNYHHWIHRNPENYSYIPYLHTEIKDRRSTPMPSERRAEVWRAPTLAGVDGEHGKPQFRLLSISKVNATSISGSPRQVLIRHILFVSGNVFTSLINLKSCLILLHIFLLNFGYCFLILYNLNPFVLYKSVKVEVGTSDLRVKTYRVGHAKKRRR